MPLPVGAHFVPGTERVRLADGSEVSKRQAYNLAAGQPVSRTERNRAKDVAASYGISQAELKRLRASPGFKEGLKRAKENGVKGANRYGSEVERRALELRKAAQATKTDKSKQAAIRAREARIRWLEVLDPDFEIDDYDNY